MRVSLDYGLMPHLRYPELPAIGGESLHADQVGPPTPTIVNDEPVMVALFKVDNVPFFTLGVACGDVVEAMQLDGRWTFMGVTEPVACYRFIVQPGDAQDDTLKVCESLLAAFPDADCESGMDMVTVQIPTTVGDDLVNGWVDKLINDGTISAVTDVQARVRD